MRVTTLARRYIHIDEVQHVSPRVIAHERRHGVVPRNVYRRSLVRPLFSRGTIFRCFRRSRKRSARTPPSTFLFLPIHLSNSPGIMAIPLPGTPGSRRSPRLPTEIGRLVTPSVRSFAGAPSRRKAGGAPLWRALYEGPHGLVNTESIRFPATSLLSTCCDAPARSGLLRTRYAALAPHSSRVVCIGERPVVTARIRACLGLVR